MNPVLKRVLTGLTVAAAVVAAIVFCPRQALAPVFALVFLLAAAEYQQLLSRKVQAFSAPWLSLFVPGVALLALAFVALPHIAYRHGNLMMLYVIALVKMSDTGGFAFGLSSARLLKGGNHKLCPTISPGKSWEGLFGSVVFSSAISCACMPWTRFGLGKALAFGVIAALVGTFGDLVESKFKRWVGVKDSSAWKITNGMGGILDMFDSLLFAPAVLYPFI